MGNNSVPKFIFRLSRFPVYRGSILGRFYCISSHFVCFVFWATAPQWAQGLLIHTVSWSHTTTHHSQKDSSWRVISSSQRPLPDNIHNRQKSMFPVGFEPTISAGERPQIYALDRAASGTGYFFSLGQQNEDGEVSGVCLPRIGWRL